MKKTRDRKIGSNRKAGKKIEIMVNRLGWKKGLEILKKRGFHLQGCFCTSLHIPYRKPYNKDVIVPSKMGQAWKKSALQTFPATVSLTSTSSSPWWSRGIAKYHDIYLFLLAFTIKSKLIHTGLLKTHLNSSTFKTKNTPSTSLGKQLQPFQHPAC